MSEDIGFMERGDWLGDDGKPFCRVFCPVSGVERYKRLSTTERKSFDSAHSDADSEARSDAVCLSALARLGASSDGGLYAPS
jgi:hypothetical protein